MPLLPLPPFSANSAGISRLPDVTRAVGTLQQMYFTATSMLTSGTFELQRVRAHQDLLFKTGLPLLATLEEVAEAESIPTDWLHDMAEKFSALLLELLEAEKAVEGRCVPLLSTFTWDSYP